MTRNTLLLMVGALLIAAGFGFYQFGATKSTAGTAEQGGVSSSQLAAHLSDYAKGDLAAMRIISSPVDLNDIKFTDQNEVPFSVKDFNGRIVLLNLWATWCPPCRHEMPSLHSLQEQKGDDQFEVVTVSIDLKDPAKPLAFLKSIDNTELTFYWDKQAKIFNDMKRIGLAFGMPTTVLIDRDGFAVGVLNGPAEWASKDALAIVEAAKTYAGS